MMRALALLLACQLAGGRMRKLGEELPAERGPEQRPSKAPDVVTLRLPGQEVLLRVLEVRRVRGVRTLSIVSAVSNLSAVSTLGTVSTLRTKRTLRPMKR